jgi:hypothetical protein
MSSTRYTALVERESTHAVFRKHVQLRLRASPDAAHQAGLLTLAVRLAGIARKLDSAFDHRAEPAGQILQLEFELNFPERFQAELDQWLAEEIELHPEVAELLVPAPR